MLRFGETKVAKKPINIWDVNLDDIVISKLIETKTISKHFTGYLDKVIRSLVLVLPTMNGYVKIFKVKDGDKDKNKKLVSFRIDDEKLSEKYETMLYQSMMIDM